jgi:hypothetical protein
MKVGALDEIADAHSGAHAVIGEALQVVDQIFARVGRLRHRPVGNVLEADMAVQVDQRRHHGLAGEVHTRRAGGHRQLTAASHLRELVVLDDEGRVLDRRTAVPDDEPRAFEHRHGGLAFHIRDAGGQQHARGDQQRRRHPRPAHGILPSNILCHPG